MDCNTAKEIVITERSKHSFQVDDGAVQVCFVRFVSHCYLRSVSVGE